VTPGSVSDVTCIRELDERFAKYGASGIRLVLDRGFYSAANLEDIVSGGGHFMMPVPGSVNLARDLIDGARAEIESDLNFVEVAEDGTSAIYGITKVDKVAAKRVWHHIYFDTARRVEHISAFFAKLATWEAELRSKRTKESNQTFYAKYFIVKTTPKRGYQVRRNMETINEYKQDYAGYWVITTNFEKDAASALELYRKRAAVEQHYDDLKNELDMMRLRTHRQETMRGRIFVHFIALILLQQLRKTATDSGVLKRDLSIRAMMKKLDSYQRVHFAGKYRDVFSTMTKSQREILAAFGLGEE
jgi:transposase